MYYAYRERCQMSDADEGWKGMLNAIILAEFVLSCFYLIFTGVRVLFQGFGS